MERYNVVCKGQLLAGHSKEQAHRELALLFKADPKTVAPLFSGKTVIVKRNLTPAAADKIRQAAARCGVKFEIQPLDGPSTALDAGASPQPLVPETQTNMVVCENCGTRQPRSSTCINCGLFIVEENTRRGNGANSGTPASTAPVPSTGSSEEYESGPIPLERASKLRRFRIGLLVVVLAVVGVSTWLTQRRVTSWNDPLQVVIYPIAGDTSEEVAAYIKALDDEAFVDIEAFFTEEAEAFEVPISKPFQVAVGPQIAELPPDPPRDRNVFKVIYWSLQMRLWAFKNGRSEPVDPDVRMFVLYYTIDDEELLDRSLGLQQGMVGVVHAYADPRAQARNNVIIAHEMLHTVGAADKYDPETHQPLYPDGFADPDQEPRYPQKLAEIMGARIPISETHAEMPDNLDSAVVGPQTAYEIRWIKE